MHGVLVLPGNQLWHHTIAAMTVPKQHSVVVRAWNKVSGGHVLTLWRVCVMQAVPSVRN